MKKRGARLGQHFLVHNWAARALARAVGTNPGDTILEIGPGKGILTKELLALGPVVAVEKDESLAARLRELFADEMRRGSLRLVVDDIRNVSIESLRLGPYVVAANIPYYITGEIIRMFLTSKHRPARMALLVQKEVAQRVVSETESLLSLSVKAYGSPRIAEKVPKKHFAPPPRVDSAILVIENISNAFFSDFSEEYFFKVLHLAFASKRKMALSNLASTFGRDHVAAAFAAAGVSEKARAETIHLREWKLITMSLLRQQ